MTLLQECPWPGNVRELQNVIERAVINSAEAKLRLSDDLRLADSKRDGEPLKSLPEIERDHNLTFLRLNIIKMRHRRKNDHQRSK